MEEDEEDSVGAEDEVGEDEEYDDEGFDVEEEEEEEEGNGSDSSDDEQAMEAARNMVSRLVLVPLPQYLLRLLVA